MLGFQPSPLASWDINGRYYRLVVVLVRHCPMGSFNGIRNYAFLISNYDVWCK